MDVPNFVPILSKDVDEGLATGTPWGPTLDDTIVRVERVICYWSRTLNTAERNYSATECEALGAKEALVKFQPFIEGETIILVTDHAALQWACIYENTNRRPRTFERRSPYLDYQESRSTTLLSGTTYLQSSPTRPLNNSPSPPKTL
ncbi:putative K02A2.6-like [Lyophyllum shimeji]|uniref:K02A2.6-like n=1 Tax=Lyophyllum shimeji TaxID=47721 RepID=A0A9P3Q330_LYOSH|nr:putative K02A2.6-like [Lyophyllum shimeji]